MTLQAASPAAAPPLLALPIEPSPAAAPPILTLPVELHLHIASFLDYQSTIRLNGVNRLFREVVDPQACDSTLKGNFVFEAQLWDKHNLMSVDRRRVCPSYNIIADGYACYNCFRVLPPFAFSGTQRTRTYGKHSSYCSRFCLECGVQEGLYLQGTYVGVPVEYTDSESRKYISKGPERFLIYCAPCGKFLDINKDCQSSALCMPCPSRPACAPLALEFQPRFSPIQTRASGFNKTTLACNDCGSFFRVEGHFHCKTCKSEPCWLCENSWGGDPFGRDGDSEDEFLGLVALFELDGGDEDDDYVGISEMFEPGHKEVQDHAPTIEATSAPGDFDDVPEIYIEALFEMNSKNGWYKAGEMQQVDVQAEKARG